MKFDIFWLENVQGTRSEPSAVYLQHVYTSLLSSEFTEGTP